MNAMNDNMGPAELVQRMSHGGNKFVLCVLIFKVIQENFIVGNKKSYKSFLKLPNFFRLFLADDCSRIIESFIYELLHLFI
jgi:hypothetical protein